MVHAVNETIDKSVFERCRLAHTYKPANLIRWADKHNVKLTDLKGSKLAIDPRTAAPD